MTRTSSPSTRSSSDYPPEVVALAEHWRDRVHAAVAAGEEPFATVGHTWLRRAEGAEGAEGAEVAPGGTGPD